MIDTPVYRFGLQQKTLALAQCAAHHVDKSYEQKCAAAPRRVTRKRIENTLRSIDCLLPLACSHENPAHALKTRDHPAGQRTFLAEGHALEVRRHGFLVLARPFFRVGETLIDFARDGRKIKRQRRIKRSKNAGDSLCDVTESRL
jgi:hypothetical protein